MTSFDQETREAAASGSTTPPGRKTKLAYVVTHPIQYQAPLLRYLSAQDDLDLMVYFQSDFSSHSYFDREFGREIEWDVPLLQGYRWEVLPAIGPTDRLSALYPLNYGIISRLWRGNYDFLWVHGYTRWLNWLAMAVARLRGCKILIRDDATELSAKRSGLKRWIKRRLFFPLLSTMIDGFLVAGSLNRSYYLQNGIPEDRIFLMPYAVDNDYFAAGAERAAVRRDAFRAELGLEPDRPVILFAGKFLQLKRPYDLLDAFIRLLPDVPRRPYLLFVGDGALSGGLRARATEISADVRFLGFRNQSELAAYYDLCSVFVLPSEFETWGLAINEAMSAGRAVIVSDRVGSGADLVQSGVNGHVFPCGDVAALSAALSDILQSPDRIEQMGRASKEILTRWSFQQDLVALRTAMVRLLKR